MPAAQWSLPEVVRAQGRDRPHAVALVTESAELSWGALDERSNRVANALAGLGIGSNDRVAFLGKNAPEYFEVLFGAAKVGAVTVAVNWRLSASEIAFIVDDAQARVMVVGAEFAATARQLEGELTTVKTVLVYGHDDPSDPRAASYQEWLAGATPDDPGHSAQPEDVAVQLYTSGTTGLPKGAMLTNANMAVLHGAIEQMFDIDQNSINLVALPTFHIGGAGYALAGMGQGCPTVLLRDFDPVAVIDALQRHRITNTFFVPAMLAALASVPGAADGDYSALRSILYGASPITEETLKLVMRTFGCDFVQVYGMTETTGAITKLAAADHDPDGPRAALLRSAGKPFDWVEIRVVDPDTGVDREPGQVGELWTRSAQNMLGYWNQPEATAQTITGDGWLRTGDAGFLDEDGYIFLTDRIKDMIVSGGENVYPIEVENVLAGHEAVADVAVIGVPDEQWGETVKAVVVLRDGTSPDAASLIAYCRDRIAHFKCPTSVEFIDVLPRNPSGKILKRELREPFWEGRQRRVN
jgi:long-chain acyl-CoA synthetase